MVAVSVTGTGIGARIRALREREHLTQGQLATRARVTRSWLSLVEAGHVENPRAIDVERVARVLGVDSRYLLTGETEPGETPDAQWFKRLPPNDQSWLRRVWRTTRDDVGAAHERLGRWFSEDVSNTDAEREHANDDDQHPSRPPPP